MLNADQLLTTRETVEADLLTWLAIHGNLCLSLRHPANRGPSRKYVVDFVKGLGKFLVDAGVMSQEQMENAYALESEEGGLEDKEGE
jgi:hypothetical protein